MTAPCAATLHRSALPQTRRVLAKDRNLRPRSIRVSAASLVLSDLLSFEGLNSLGINEQAVLVLSAAFSSASLAVNFFGGVAQEKKRAELQLELEREKQAQEQLAEVRSVIARFRGPLLEAAIDLEQLLWHLVTDPRQPQRRAEECAHEIRYLLFTLAQLLGFLEVLRREGPRERAFLQTNNPHASETLSSLVEGIRFVLCSSPSGLEKWYLEGRDRPHPGCRVRQVPDVPACASSAAGASTALGAELLRVRRGTQRAIGSLMIISGLGAERAYTQSYSDFYQRMEADAEFKRWLEEIEADVRELATGPPWAGERPFPVGCWTRVLLLQQLLVELMDVLDPDCVRLPMSRRVRLMPLQWGPLPNIEWYQQQLKDLSRVGSYTSDEEGGQAGAALEGIRDLVRTVVEEAGGATKTEGAEEAATAAAAASAGSPHRSSPQGQQGRPGAGSGASGGSNGSDDEQAVARQQQERVAQQSGEQQAQPW